MKSLPIKLPVIVLFLILMLGTQSLTAQKSIKWLKGTWHGTGYQPIDGESWSVKLQSDGKKMYIDYESLKCGGEWKLVKKTKKSAEFVEEISMGETSCDQGGQIIVHRIDERFISVSYFLPQLVDGVVATAVLDKKLKKPRLKSFSSRD